MSTDASERGLERLICTTLADDPRDSPRSPTETEEFKPWGGVGWVPGDFHHYGHEHCVDLPQVAAFLRETQPRAAESLSLSEDGPTRRKFLARLQGEISRRGTIEVLRNGIKFRDCTCDRNASRPNRNRIDCKPWGRLMKTRPWETSPMDSRWAAPN